MAGKWAPDNAQGEHPYLVRISPGRWSDGEALTSICYATSVSQARERSGWVTPDRTVVTTARRARAKDVRNQGA